MYRLSDISGGLSILCWLGAQLPQTIKNYQLQSVDGLSLTFLANWFIGDGCNLIGCLLTHQLPFQTILAIYFVFVDATLLGQYMYYGGWRAKSKGEKGLEADAEAGIEEPLLIGEDDLVRSYASISTIGAGPKSNRSRTRSRSRSLAHYQAVERIASNITTAAEQMTERAATLQDRPEDMMDEDVSGAMLASFYSERSVRTNVSALSGISESARSEGAPPATSSSSGGLHKGRTKSKRNKHVSWTRAQDLQGTPRGRSTSTGPEEEEGETEEGSTPTATVAIQEIPSQSTSGSRSHTRPRPSRSRTGASTGTGSIVFMAVWTLFGIRTYRDGFPPSLGLFGTGVQNGRVLHDSKPPIMMTPTSQFTLPVFNSQPPLPRPLFFVFTNSTIYDSYSKHPPPPRQDPNMPPKPPPEQTEPPPAPKIDKERLLGRISAWICTTFYLTCRMPQIWKNFVRKSCQGLSPFLFLFAFLGNTFYVLSIITSPEAKGPGAVAFLLESLPYLVGSGGVLTFDIIILTQVWIYRGRKPRSSVILITGGGSRSRRGSYNRGRRDSVRAVRSYGSLGGVEEGNARRESVTSQRDV